MVWINQVFNNENEYLLLVTSLLLCFIF